MFEFQQIHDGVSHAAKLYPNAYVIMIIIGMLWFHLDISVELRTNSIQIHQILP